MAHLRDSPVPFQDQVSQLAQAMRQAHHIVVYTGAGVSTSAQIPDFRGPGGVWTLQAQGRLPESITMEQALPTVTHMALVGLVEGGVVSSVVSQNVDGLHRRSGLRREHLAELHGNCFVEVCGACQKEHVRSFDVCEHHGNAAPTYDFHDTGRRCASVGCNGALRNTIVNFGEQLPESHLAFAMSETRKADLALVLGSSMTVRPACDMPQIVKKQGGKLVIVNLQATPIDRLADLRIVADTDLVMQELSRALSMTIPTFDVDSFKVCVADDLHGKEFTLRHSIAGDGSKLVSVTSPGMNGEDVVHHVEFIANNGSITDIQRAPFELSVRTSTVKVRVYLLDQTLAPIEVDFDLTLESSCLRVVR